MERIMTANVARLLLASVALGGLCLTTDAFARGGGGHGGGGHFGGGEHFGSGHFGGMHFGDGDVGAASFGHGLGRIGSGGRGYYGAGGGARFHDLAEVHGHGFNRNAFGSERAWDRWGDRH
jgi:hypothetical protein